MKDFNTLKLNGKIWSKEDLQSYVHSMELKEDYLLEFWGMLGQLIDDKSYIEVQSSGSTGEPKLIRIEKNKLLASAKMTCRYFELSEKHTALLCLSTKHIGGLMMLVRAFYSGMNLIVQKASANPLLTTEESIDFVAMVPYQVQTCLLQNPEKLKRIKTVLIGGGAIQKQLEDALVKHNIRAFSSFGMTESISHFAVREIGKQEYYQCLEHIEIELSARGTLILKAPTLLDEKLETNDLIELKGKDKFKWLGRSDFAIESGGLKMHPEQIERKLESAFKERIIISSLPSISLNNELVLVVEGEKREIKEEAFSELKNYERPKRIFFIEKFPETNTKINRLKTREMLLKKMH
ncbi:MAG: AMP-binding protein [Chitinophagales bacterium]|nr:AMP-binding protein [Bacteroidota bacterium]MCB9256254.1 AMP-binding protein [Chitinophagales bacterium]